MILSSLLLSKCVLFTAVLVQDPFPPRVPDIDTVQVGSRAHSQPGFVELEIRTPHWQPSRDLMIANMHFVVLPLDGGPLANPVVSGVTDAEGKATIVVPRQFVKVRGDGSVWANIMLREEGKQSRRAFHLRHNDAPWGRASKLYQWNLMSIDIFDGCTTFGQTMDSSGRPIATPVLFRDEFGSALSQLPPKRRTMQYRNLGNGWHVVHHMKNTVVHGSAKYPGVGTGSLQILQLNCDGLRQPFKLTLTGEGVLQGTVVDQNGEPVAGVRLSFDKRGLKKDALASKPGNNSGSTKTNREGRFKVSGMQPGTYRVRVYDAPLPAFTTPTWHDQRFQADGEDSLISLKQIRLQVHILSSSGERWNEALTVQRRFNFHNRPTVRDFISQADAPRIVVTKAGSACDAHLANHKETDGVRIENDLYSFLVEDGQEYWVGIIGGNFPMTFQKIRISKGHDYTHVSLKEAEASEYGVIKIQAMRTIQKVIRPTLLSNTHAWVETVPEGIRVLEELPLYGAYIESNLPVGRYRVVVKGTPGDRSCGFGERIPRTLGFEDLLVEVKTGEFLVVNPMLKTGAQLEMAIATKSEKLPCRLHDSKGSFALQGTPTEPYATIRLHHNSRRSTPVQYYSKEGNPLRGPSNHWLLNETITSERLPYGDYTLVTTLCDGRVNRTPIKLESGKTTAITVQF